MEQGAVSWLAEQIEKHTWYDDEGFAYVKVSFLDIQKAKAIEKEQMKEMYLKGISNYDPTFKTK